MAKINLNNAQFRAFTQFAASVADKGTILKAEDTLTAADGSPRKIVAKAYDHYGHILRKQNSKNINNDIRTLFMNTVLDMFGAKNDKELPKDVRDALITKDYGKGRPLTAAAPPPNLPTRLWSNLSPSLHDMARGARH